MVGVGLHPGSVCPSEKPIYCFSCESQPRVRHLPVCCSRSNSSGQHLAAGLPGLSVVKNGKTKAPRPQALPAEAWGRQARRRRLKGWEGRREGGVVATPEHKNNEARGAMGPSWLVPESLSDLDRCHSWAPGEELQPPAASMLQPAPPSPGQGRLRLLQASHRQTPTRDGKGESPGCGGDWEGSHRAS